MNLFAVSSLACGVSCTILALIALIFGKIRIHRILAFFNISVAIWGYGCYIVGVAVSENVALFGWKVAHVGGIFVGVFFYHIVCIFCELKRKKLIRITYFIGFIFLSFNIFGAQLINKTRFVFDSLYYNKATNLFIVLAILWLLIVVLGFFELARYFPRSRGSKRAQALYMIFGFLTGFVGGISTFMPEFNVDIYPFGNITIPFYALILTYAILRYRLLDIRVVVSRAVAFFLTYPLLLGVPFFLAYKFRLVLYANLGINWWLVPSGTITVIAMLAPVVYGRIKRRMDETLLAEQKKYQKLLRQAASGMVTQHDLTKLSRLIVYIVKKAVRLKFAAIFLDHHKEGVYRLKAIRDGGDVKHENISFMYEYPFIDYLRSHKKPVLFEELPQRMKDSLTVPEGISLIIPIFTEGYLVGFVLLGEKMNRQAYSNDDVDVFKTLADQVSLAIENCIFMEESKQAQERIFAAEKLASIGGMADGLAHQIKNRLNQFSIASGELKYEIEDVIKRYSEFVEKNPEFKKSMDYITSISESLMKNVKRTDDVIKGILQFARVDEKETFFSFFSLKEPVDLSIELLKVKHGLTKIPIKVDLGESDEIYGVKAQITESMYNLLDNAYEATHEKKTALYREGKTDYVPLIELILTQKEKISLIEVSDNGSGIEKGNEYKIFAPFFTTKSSYKSGTGIGIYVVKRMIEENHKGTITFVSRWGLGTKFSIELPRGKAKKNSSGGRNE